jgi:hypothetical protein
VIYLFPVTCPPLDLPDELIPSSSNHTVGTVVTFDCQPGWQVSENIAIACFLDGNWSDIGPIPTCVEEGGRFTHACF